jgi:glutamate-1-semialdehyde 2,1-aminomutase
MLNLSAALADGLKQRIAQRALPWHVTSVGARSELIMFSGRKWPRPFRHVREKARLFPDCSAKPPRTAHESLAASEPALERVLHLYLLNRGVLVTPFHNMMLVSPATSHAQVDLLLAGFERFIDELA